MFPYNLANALAALKFADRSSWSKKRCENKTVYRRVKRYASSFAILKTPTWPNALEIYLLIYGRLRLFRKRVSTEIFEKFSIRSALPCKMGFPSEINHFASRVRSHRAINYSSIISFDRAHLGLPRGRFLIVAPIYSATEDAGSGRNCRPPCLRRVWEWNLTGMSLFQSSDGLHSQEAVSLRAWTFAVEPKLRQCRITFGFEVQFESWARHVSGSDEYDVFSLVLHRGEF